MKKYMALLNNADNIMFGSNEVNKIYLGTNEIWTRSAPISNYFNPDNLEEKVYVSNYEIAYYDSFLNVRIYGVVSDQGGYLYFRLNTTAGKSYSFSVQSVISNCGSVIFNNYLTGTSSPTVGNVELRDIPIHGNPYIFTAQGETTFAFKCCYRGVGTVGIVDPQIILIE